jgi:hypothetical protein
MRWRVGATLIALWAVGEVGAGELMLANGSRLAGELTNEVLIVSTGSDLIELAPDEVSVITPGEVRLKDGRMVRGTLVGGQLRLRTSLGEIAVRPEELHAYRADVRDAASGASPGPSSPVRYQAGDRTPDAEPPGGRAPAAVTAATPRTPMPSRAPSAGARAGRGAQLEVVAEEAALRRDAIAAADPIGRVSRGDRVTYLDAIDRRLHLLNVLVFDGGQWVRVRSADGTEGWLPAAAVRATR